MSSTTAQPNAARYAGARVKRIEDRRLLTGQGTYVDDIAFPGMLHAVLVRSPFPRATIAAIDVSAALAAPGVRFVFTAADLNPDAGLIRERGNCEVYETEAVATQIRH